MISPWSKATVPGGEISSAHFGWLAGRCDRPRCPGTSARRHSLRNETKAQALRLRPAPRQAARPCSSFARAARSLRNVHEILQGRRGYALTIPLPMAELLHRTSRPPGGRPCPLRRTTCPCRELLSRCVEPKRREARSNRTGDSSSPKVESPCQRSKWASPPTRAAPARGRQG